jgi:predicted transcriptional regulator
LKRDPSSVILNTLQNPTKLGVLFLLMRHPKLTVTQMSKDIGVSKANLYHFVGQMVKEGLLSKPEVAVRGNYVEKYYRLQWKALASVDPADQKKKVKVMNPEQQREILQSFVASVSLVSRLLAEEIRRSDKGTLERIHQAFQSDLVSMSYMVLPDSLYEQMIRKLNGVVEETRKGWGGEGLPFKGNRIIILGLPQLQS